MRVAALYDIHGNAPALDAVLTDLQAERVDRIVIGGDVLPGPLARETLDRLRELGERAVFVRGNGDRSVVDAFDAGPKADAGADEPARRWSAWTAARIDREDRALLASFTERVTLDVDGLGPTLFCHGSPRSDEEILTTLTPQERWGPALEAVSESTVVCGHTHAQFDRELGRWRLINAGSVGMPYEGRAGAYWLLLGPEVELRRSDYDIESAAAAMRAAGNPDTDDLLRESLLEPMDAREVAELFERQAVSASGGAGSP